MADAVGQEDATLASCSATRLPACPRAATAPTASVAPGRAVRRPDRRRISRCLGRGQPLARAVSQFDSPAV